MDDKEKIRDRVNHRGGKWFNEYDFGTSIGLEDEKIVVLGKFETTKMKDLETI